MLNFTKKIRPAEMRCSLRIDGTKTDRHGEVNSRFSRFCEYV